MPGPYFIGQTLYEDGCGCYYPDLVVVEDVVSKGKRIMQCENHGLLTVPLPPDITPISKRPIPTPKWRAAEKCHLREMVIVL